MQYFLQLQDNTNIIFGFADNSAEILDLNGFSVVQYSTTEANFNPIGKVFENGNIVVNIQDLRAIKIAALDADFNASKKLTLKNGTTWVIEGATYKALKDKLILIFSENADLTKVYTFFEGDTSKPNYYVNVICYIWRYILKDFYEVALGVGNNRKVYDFTKADIMNAQDLTTLNAITWSFTPAEVIDVSDKAAELEQQANTPQYVLDVIVAAKDAQGEIHLVQTA